MNHTITYQKCEMLDGSKSDGVAFASAKTPTQELVYVEWPNTDERVWVATKDLKFTGTVDFERPPLRKCDSLPGAFLPGGSYPANDNIRG